VYVVLAWLVLAAIMQQEQPLLRQARFHHTTQHHCPPCTLCCLCCCLCCSALLLCQAFQELQEEAPELLLLGGVRAAVGPDDLAAVQAAEPAIREQWDAAGLLAPAQILAAVQGLGYELERRVSISAAGGKPQQQQQQQQQDELCAVVDVCVKLQDGRRVAVLVSAQQPLLCSNITLGGRRCNGACWVPAHNLWRVRSGEACVPADVVKHCIAAACLG
jgi:hypothetical protein